jgi:multiple sugar transport system ATP-binding protein
MATVRFDNVQKVYDNGYRALSDFSLEIADKELVIFVGPSGCGKSTTIRILAGLEEISGGQVEIGGRVVNDLAPKDRNVAMVFQDYALYPHMTVGENMSLGLRLKKTPKDVIRKTVAEAAEVLGLTEHLNNYPRELSGGQRQRVAVGRAIVRTPDVFLFDEPLSNLDPKVRTTMRLEIKKLHQRLSATMIYVTHDQIEAMTLGDKIVVLEGGNIQQVADPVTLYDHPANKFVAGFIGTPPMNFFDAKVDGERVVADGFAMPVPSGLAPDFPGAPAVTLGVRAEDMRLHDEAADGLIHARVDVTEPVGAEVFIHLITDAGDHPFVVKEMSHRVGDLRPGDPVFVGVAPDRLHLFDVVHERALTVGGR